MKAIYTRQSKDKKDSLSIEAQIEMCKKFLEPDEKFELFCDRGISGKNTARPEFQRMLKKIKKGEFSGVIVYKLDRFSRRTADFMTIYEILEQNNVQFISCNERFDTSTPMGKAMLAITAAFAQMERETIVERCRDTYYTRAEKGLYIGGRAPFGFDKIPAKKNGIKTAKLIENTKNAEIVRRIYALHTENLLDYSKILEILNSEKPEKPFNIDLIKGILRNPIYVKADLKIYNYLKNQGAVFHSEISEFDGKNGLVTYNDPKKRKVRKFTNFDGENIFVAMHEGLIDSEIWLKARKTIDNQPLAKNAGKSRATWLSGSIKCGYCGLAVTTCGGGSDNRNYWVTCGGRRNKYCYERKKIYTFAALENEVEVELMEYLKKLPATRAKRKSKEKTELKSLDNKLLNLEIREKEISKIAFNLFGKKSPTS